MRVTPMPYEPIVTVTSLPFSSSTLSPSVSAKKRPSWKTWPISMPRASSTGPEPSGAGSPGAHVRDLDEPVGREVAARDERVHVLLVDVRARDPRRAVDDPRVEKVPDAGGRLLAEDRARLGPRPDVALHEQRVALEVLRRRSLDGGGGEGDLGALVVDLAVAGDAHDHELARAVEVREGEHDVLERVGGGVLAVEVRVRVRDEGLDRRGVGRVEDDRRRAVRRTGSGRVRRS